MIRIPGILRCLLRLPHPLNARTGLVVGSNGPSFYHGNTRCAVWFCLLCGAVFSSLSFPCLSCSLTPHMHLLWPFLFEKYTKHRCECVFMYRRVIDDPGEPLKKRPKANTQTQTRSVVAMKSKPVCWYFSETMFFSFRRCPSPQQKTINEWLMFRYYFPRTVHNKCTNSVVSSRQKKKSECNKISDVLCMLMSKKRIIAPLKNCCKIFDRILLALFFKMSRRTIWTFLNFFSLIFLTLTDSTMGDEMRRRGGVMKRLMIATTAVTATADHAMRRGHREETLDKLNLTPQGLHCVNYEKLLFFATQKRKKQQQQMENNRNFQMPEFDRKIRDENSFNHAVGKKSLPRTHT